MSGLTSGEVRTGDHASISAVMSDASTILTYAWGSTLDGTEHGTGPNPSASPDSTTMFLTVTTSAGTFRTSAPIRYAAPTFSAQPTLDQATYNEGDTVTLTEGIAGPGATLTIEQFAIDGADVSGQIAGLTWDTTGRDIYGDDGLIEYQVRATNSGGFVLSDVITATLRDVPAAFAAGDWTTSGGVTGDLDIVINSLPDNGNAAITDIEYRVNGGAWQSSGGTVGFNIPGLANGSTDFELRAVNAVGASVASDLKTVTISGGSSPSASMSLLMRTTGANEDVTIRTRNLGTFNATIDWGDGNNSTITAWDDPDLTHQYAVAGDYTVTVSGQFANLHNNGLTGTHLIEVQSLGELGWHTQGLIDAFNNEDNLTTFIAGTTDIQPSSLEQTFRRCESLTTVDFSGLSGQVANGCTFNRLFSLCTALVSVDMAGLTPVAGAGTTSLSRAFEGCTSLSTVTNLTGFATSSFNNTFVNCPTGLTIDLSGIDIESCGVFTAMFTNSGLDTASYDATLIAWAAQDAQDSEIVDFGNSVPSASALSARASLISDDLWTINDGFVATITIDTIGPQASDGNVPVTYTINADDGTVEAVIFDAASANPVAADFNTGATSGYIDLGQVALTQAGSNIALSGPDGLLGNFKLAYLPTGGGDSDVAVSPSFALDSTDSVISPSAFVTGSGSGEVDWSFTPDEAGTYRVSIFADGATPTNQEIEDGTGAVATATGSGTGAAQSAGTLTGVAATAYDGYIWYQDAFNNDVIVGPVDVTSGAAAPSFDPAFIDTFAMGNAEPSSTAASAITVAASTELTLLVQYRTLAAATTFPTVTVGGVTANAEYNVYADQIGSRVYSVTVPSGTHDIVVTSGDENAFDVLTHVWQTDGVQYDGFSTDVAGYRGSADGTADVTTLASGTILAGLYTFVDTAAPTFDTVVTQRDSTDSTGLATSFRALAGDVEALGAGVNTVDVTLSTDTSINLALVAISAGP